jgi:ABC-2 type transport system permease protein
MNGILTIFRREMWSYFTSPYTYLIGAVFLLLAGFFFSDNLWRSIGTEAANPAAIPDFLAFGMIFFAPLLTMRSLAEESREGTMELLLTAPVSDNAIVLGKFISAWAFYSILLLITLLYQAILVGLGAFPDLGIAISAYMGIWLYGGATLSIGLAYSALTDSQIVAGFLSMSTLFLLYMGDNIGLIVSNIDLARFIRKLTLQGHYSTSFSFGIFRAEDVMFFTAIIIAMLFITIRIVESKRWR